MHAFESNYPFCSNLRCKLHIRAGDTGVHGFGNWARMPDGRMISRGLYNGIFLCDPCGIASVRKKSKSGKLCDRADQIQ